LTNQGFPARIVPMTYKLLDLFCGVGGAGAGYSKAGFHVTGVDHIDQPNYGGDNFIKADALDYLMKNGRLYDAIHASPPCQAFSSMSAIHNRKHPDLIKDTRTLLNIVSKPWIIENVPSAPLEHHLMLCGTMFNLGYGKKSLIRHRSFEIGKWGTDFNPPPCKHTKDSICIVGHGGTDKNHHSPWIWKKALGIEWGTDRSQLAQAIPPAYTHFIGTYLLQYLSSL
jgi:hypothetical protein